MNDDIRTLSGSKNKLYCPIFAICRFWDYLGRPLIGPVFPKTPFLKARVDVRSSFYIVRKMAKKLGWSQIPQKHSPRISMLAFLAKAGFNSSQLNHHFGWTANSIMTWHYLGQNLACASDSPAAKIAKCSEIEKKRTLSNKLFHLE